MTTIAEALTLALQHHKAGRLREAEQIYLRVLKIEANQADALHLLGLVARHTARPAKAVDYLRRAVAAKVGVPEFRESLGDVLADQAALPAAAESYRGALALNPSLDKVLHKLGTVLARDARPQEGLACLHRAIELRPTYAEAHISLGTTWRGLVNDAASATMFRRALCLDPASYAALSNLGSVLLERGEFQRAIAIFSLAMSVAPDSAEANCNLGNAYKQGGNAAAATDCFRCALINCPQLSHALCNLGGVKEDAGLHVEAFLLYRRAERADPKLAEAHLNLGNLLLRMGRGEEAVNALRVAVRLSPAAAVALGSLASALAARGQHTEAARFFERALVFAPGFPEALGNLGNSLVSLARLRGGLIAYRRAVHLKPEYWEAHGNLSGLLFSLGRIEEATAAGRRALELNPHYVPGRSNLLLGLQYSETISPSELLEAHVDFDRRHAAQLPPRALPDRAEQGSSKRLRLGFVSPDFRQHAVGIWAIRCFEHLGATSHAIIFYSDVLDADTFTERFRRVADEWHDIRGMSDEALAAKIAADRIDILFDLAGHTEGNRLMTFARKPAPLQISWIGYPGTTGLQAMDYLVADRHLVPAGAEEFYRERILRLPDGHICHEPPPYAPPVGPLPALASGYVTFGCFNNPAKIGPVAVRLWSQILRRLPSARLSLKYRGMDDPLNMERFQDLFRREGINLDRLIFQGHSTHADSLAAYNAIDIALDPVGFSGGLTTCDALWMGVPVVTCPGRTFASRQSLSLLSSVGFDRSVAADYEQYVELATNLAADLPELARTRAAMRGVFAASSLCDGDAFARGLLCKVEEIWTQQTAGGVGE